MDTQDKQPMSIADFAKMEPNYTYYPGIEILKSKYCNIPAVLQRTTADVAIVNDVVGAVDFFILREIQRLTIATAEIICNSIMMSQKSDKNKDRLYPPAGDIDFLDKRLKLLCKSGLVWSRHYTAQNNSGHRFFFLTEMGGQVVRKRFGVSGAFEHETLLSSLPISEIMKRLAANYVGLEIAKGIRKAVKCNACKFGYDEDGQLNKVKVSNYFNIMVQEEETSKMQVFVEPLFIREDKTFRTMEEMLHLVKGRVEYLTNKMRYENQDRDIYLIFLVENMDCLARMKNLLFEECEMRNFLNKIYITTEGMFSRKLKVPVQKRFMQVVNMEGTLKIRLCKSVPFIEEAE